MKKKRVLLLILIVPKPYEQNTKALILILNLIDPERVWKKRGPTWTKILISKQTTINGLICLKFMSKWNQARLTSLKKKKKKKELNTIKVV